MSEVITTCPHCGQPTAPKPTDQAIVQREAEALAAELGVDASDLLGKSRLTARARHRLWLRLAEQGWSNRRIAMVCGVDTTTVLQALRMLRRREASHAP